MTYSVKSNILYKDGKKVETRSTKKTSGKFSSANPRFIVIHYTAGINFSSDVTVLSTSSIQASCQLVVSPEGKVVQIGTFRDILWHAGRSSWRGISGLNSSSIGIEVTNPGWVEYAYNKDGINYYKFPTNGKVYWNDKDHTIVKARHPNGGPVKYWVQFTSEQMEALEGIIKALSEAYPTIQEVVGHDMISPDRKIDPGPCLPDGSYQKFNSLLSSKDESFVVYNTKGSGLNIRSGPASTHSRVDLIHEGGMVKSLGESSGVWRKVSTKNNKIGWAHSAYLKRV